MSDLVPNRVSKQKPYKMLYNILYTVFLSYIILFVFSYFIPSSAFASSSVVINEFLVNPSGLDTNEWIELYSSDPNFSSPDYWIDDDNALLVNNAVQTGSDDPGSDPVHLTLDFQGNNFFVIPLSSYLNNDKNGDHPTLFLYQNDQAVVEDDYSYSSNPGDDVTIGRSPDGVGTFAILSSSTKGVPNSGPLPFPTPTVPDPTDTPSPTKTPTPTKTPSPTRTPTLRPTSGQALSRTPTPDVIPTNTPRVSTTASQTAPTKKPTPAVLGEETSEPDPTINLDVVDATSQETGTDSGPVTEASSEEEGEKKAGMTFPFILIAIGAILTIGFGTPLVLQELRSRWKKS